MLAMQSMVVRIVGYDFGIKTGKKSLILEYNALESRHAWNYLCLLNLEIETQIFLPWKCQACKWGKRYKELDKENIKRDRNAGPTRFIVNRKRWQRFDIG
jgi:hypothetical protein